MIANQQTKTENEQKSVITCRKKIIFIDIQANKNKDHVADEDYLRNMAPR